MTSSPEKTVLVTGVSGNLGVRLLPQLADFSVIGVDLVPPRTDGPLRFYMADLGTEPSCRQLVGLLQETQASAVVHLAFVIDPVRTGILDPSRMWQINVAGTGRVMEAITEVNRSGGTVNKFIFLSSVSAYGSDLPPFVQEDYPLGGHTLAYAIHKREADEVAQVRAATLGACSTYILRPPIYAGASVQNYLIGVLRGTPTGRGRLAERLREKGKRLPLLVPWGQRYLHQLFQFVHVDDVARLIAWLLRRTAKDPRLNIFNIAGRGGPVTLARCAQIAGAPLKRIPGKMAYRAALQLGWDLGISAAPPEAWPYMIGSYTMNTDRIRALLGSDYESVFQYTVEAALADSFVPTETPQPAQPAAV